MTYATLYQLNFKDGNTLEYVRVPHHDPYYLRTEEGKDLKEEFPLAQLVNDVHLDHPHYLRVVKSETDDVWFNHNDIHNVRTFRTRMI